MAPPGGAKRVKGVSIFRPFMYGTTARPFSKDNPKPAGTPDDHTHSWTVFVKAVDDSDITYWLKKVQFKLHESIPNHVQNIEAVPGQPFSVSETGWGEFEIGIKLHYPPISGEKTNMIYHHLRLHPWGSDEDKEEMIKKGEVICWQYDEQVFNEPLEPFYEILTSPGDHRAGGGSAGGKKKIGTGGMVSLDRRDALIPPRNTPGNMYSREAEELEVRNLRNAQSKIEEMKKEMLDEVAKKEKLLTELRA